MLIMRIDVNWVKTVYSNGRGWHVGNIVQWKGVYYICFVACDTVGHAPLGIHNSVNLLTSPDGERWEWVTEIVHGSNVYLASVSLT